jgi:pSer/pThr/pTyr-binding forkhead associated (FHA) protein
VPVVMVAEGGRTGQVAPISRLLRVGRGGDAELRLDDACVSRLHCSFEHADAEVTLRDLRSLNGTRLNGRRVTYEVLRSGDRIRVGQTTLIYFDDGGELGELFGASADPASGPPPNNDETRAIGGRQLPPLEPA